MTLSMRSRRPAGERSLALHPCIFLCTFSNRKWNAFVLDLPRCTGNPKYLPKEDSVFIVKMDLTMLQWCSWALGESIINDFCILMISPNARQNSLMVWCRCWHCCGWTAVKNIASSANNRWLIGGAVLDILTPRHVRFAWACIRQSKRTSMHSMKR